MAKDNFDFVVDIDRAARHARQHPTEIAIGYRQGGQSQ
jgi:hypothetical protein